MSHEQEWTGTVLSNENIATFLKELVVELPVKRQFHYLPGSYVLFHIPPFRTCTDEWRTTIHPKYIPDWEKCRLFGHTINFSTISEEITNCAFTIASYPAEGNILKFNIRIVPPPIVEDKFSENTPWGVCSSYAFSLKKADRVHFSGPYGEAFMINDDREIVFLIGGAGASFARSHLLHLFLTEKTQRKVTLWYGARSHKDNVYEQEFKQLVKDFPNFQYHLVLSDPHPDDVKAGWPVNDPIQTNLLYSAFEEGQLKHMKSPDQCLFYVCGPPMLNKTVLQLLNEYSISRDNIILDDFGRL